jgi:hypothetical protein
VSTCFSLRHNRAIRLGRLCPACGGTGAARSKKRRSSTKRHITTITTITTIAPKLLTRIEHTVDEDLVSIDDIKRPATRGECADGERPCPFVSCKYHLFLDVNPRTGSIKINFPDLEPDEIQETCALDVADGDGRSLETIGELLNLTRERIRQIEIVARLKLEMNGAER